MTGFGVGVDPGLEEFASAKEEGVAPGEMIVGGFAPTDRDLGGGEMGERDGAFDRRDFVGRERGCGFAAATDQDGTGDARLAALRCP